MSYKNGTRLTGTPEQLQDRLNSFAVDVWNHTREFSGDPSITRICDQLARAATSTAAN